MRKALIAVITAVVLFAIGAFAAELTVDSDNLASGQDPVAKCGDAEVEWNTNDVVNTAGDWTATGATVSFEAADCEGATVDLAVGRDTTGDGARDSWQDWTCGTVSSGAVLCSPPSGSAPAVVEVVDVAVLANGNSVDATILP